METVRDDANGVQFTQSLLDIFDTVASNEIQQLDHLKKKIYGNASSEMSHFFNEFHNHMDTLMMLPPIAKPLKGRKKKQAPRPDIIIEEMEDGDVEVLSVPTASLVSNEEGVEAQDTTVSSTTNRPRRAAVNVAEEKIKKMSEISGTRKLRRPSDFNQNDHVNYNVYNLNQTNGKVDESCFPRTKRRKGSGANSSVVTSSHFFSSTMIHSSSPIQKGLQAGKGLEVSMIPPHTECIVEVDEVSIHRTRTRTLRQRKPEDAASVVVKEEAMEVEDEKENVEDEKENVEENGQDTCSTDEETIQNSKSKKPTRKANKEKNKSADNPEPSHSESDSDTGRSTRTKTVKKPVNRVENLPDVRASPGKTIGEKIREKVDLFENGGAEKTSGGDTSSDVSGEGRVTRTKARKMNKSPEDENSKAQSEFKVPLAVKNSKDTKKMATTKKPVEKTREVDTKQALLEERKRLREERAQKAAQARDLAEKEKRENAQKLEREREEKLKLKKERDEKIKEEMEKKRQLTQAKIEQKRKEDEAARKARLQEIMDEEARKEAKWKKEQELAERKAQAAQQAKLAEKLKASKQVKKDVQPVEETNYSISEEPVPSDEDEENQPKRPIPSWARSINRNVVLADQIYLSSLVPAFLENPADFNPSLTDIFGENVRLRPRTSSAVWDSTVTE